MYDYSGSKQNSETIPCAGQRLERPSRLGAVLFDMTGSASGFRRPACSTSSDAGFLRDPVGDHFGRDELRSLSDLRGYRALALLGEPGIGKSSELRQEHDRIRSYRGCAAAIDLCRSEGQFVRGSLRRRIFEAPAFEAWKAGAGHLILHLDSLDEAMLRVETLASLLAEELQAVPVGPPLDSNCVPHGGLACRHSRDGVHEIWEEASVGVFELAPLRRRDVLTALAAHGIDADPFVRDLFGAHAVPFAIKPLTLDMLIKIHQRHGSLPSSTAELYRQGCLELAEEQNISRLETRRRGRLNGPQRLRVAGRIAAGTVLGGRVAIWTGIDADCPAEDVPVSRLSGATEQGDFAGFTATDDDVREVLDTGLFSSRGDHRMGWAHQSYGEFLATLYLKDKRVPARTILQVLTHPTGGLIPQLAVVAAWTASLSAELRASLIAADPWALLHGDLSNWEAPDLELLTRSMLDHVEQGRFYEHFFGMTETYAKLAHPGLVAQLRPVIVSRSLKTATRRVALNIAERCGLKELQPEILNVVLDGVRQSCGSGDGGGGPPALLRRVGAFPAAGPRARRGGRRSPGRDQGVCAGSPMANPHQHRGCLCAADAIGSKLLRWICEFHVRVADTARDAGSAACA